MKIGAPNHPRKNLVEEIEWIGKNGFDFVDLFLEEDKTVPDKINTKRVKELINKYSLDVIGHTGWYLQTSSPIKDIRDSVINEVERYLKTFNELGVRKVTIHANWFVNLFSVKESISLQGMIIETFSLFI